jgi:hypothetical protein
MRDYAKADLLTFSILYITIIVVRHIIFNT